MNDPSLKYEGRKATPTTEDGAWGRLTHGKVPSAAATVAYHNGGNFSFPSLLPKQYDSVQGVLDTHVIMYKEDTFKAHAGDLTTVPVPTLDRIPGIKKYKDVVYFYNERLAVHEKLTGQPRNRLDHKGGELYHGDNGFLVVTCRTNVLEKIAFIKQPLPGRRSTAVAHRHSTRPSTPQQGRSATATAVTPSPQGRAKAASVESDENKKRGASEDAETGPPAKKTRLENGTWIYSGVPVICPYV